MYIDYLQTPIAKLEIQASEKGVSIIHFIKPEDPKNKAVVSPNKFTEQCKQQLTEYFLQSRTVFDVQLDMQGTSFQMNVWKSLLKIPFGAVVTYGDIAHMIDNPKAVRAVGAANGRNPISIIVPCHRVIGSNGTLTGYGGGLHNKEWLLKHETEESLILTGQYL